MPLAACCQGRCRLALGLPIDPPEARSAPDAHPPRTSNRPLLAPSITYSTIAEELVFSLFHRTVESRASITTLLFTVPLLHTIPDLTGLAKQTRRIRVDGRDSNGKQSDDSESGGRGGPIPAASGSEAGRRRGRFYEETKGFRE
ncbi:hypothetical protein BHE74_00027170 [Ensete ventricosum]|nr:hypothetical protein BHE74_00027170 [Ensete ventricosum]